MLGKQIKSYQHLFRTLDKGFSKIILTSSDVYMMEYKFFRICDVLKYGDKIYIFYHPTEEQGIDLRNIVDSETYSHIQSLEKKGAYLITEDYQGGLFRNVYLLPPTFESDFDAFCKTNKTLVSKINVSDDIKRVLFALTDGSKNYFAWAASLTKHTSHLKLLMILQWAKNNKQLTKRLGKGSITAYKNKEIDKLCGEIRELNLSKRVNDAINMFNTAQKKLLKENLENLTHDDKRSLSRLLRLSTTKRQNLIQKVSTIKDFVEITDYIKSATKVSFKWDIHSFMESVGGINSDGIRIAIKGDGFVVVEVLDFESIKFLGKNTNWCIAKDKGSWNGYSNGNDKKQYILFDFTKKEDDDYSIVGFTTLNGLGVKYAHSLTNKDLSEFNTQESSYHYADCGFVSYSVSNAVKRINTLLFERGIDIDMLCEMHKFPFTWDCMTVLATANSITNDIEVIKQTKDQLVFAVYSRDFLDAFLGKPDLKLKDKSPNEYVLVFCDFTEPINQGLLFAVIEKGFGLVDYVSNWFNHSLMPITKDIDVVLHKYKLPYDTIKRPNDPTYRFKRAFGNCNMAEIRECMLNDNYVLQTAIQKGKLRNSFGQFLHVSFEVKSFDYLNLVYGNGYTLYNDILGMDTTNLLEYAVSKLRKIPSNESIELFFLRKIVDENENENINAFLVLENILNHEENYDLFVRFLNIVETLDVKDDIKFKIWEKCLKRLKSLKDFEEHREKIIKGLYPCILKNENKRLKELFSELGSTADMLLDQSNALGGFKLIEADQRVLRAAGFGR